MQKFVVGLLAVVTSYLSQRGWTSIPAASDVDLSHLCLAPNSPNTQQSWRYLLVPGNFVVVVDSSSLMSLFFLFSCSLLLLLLLLVVVLSALAGAGRSLLLCKMWRWVLLARRQQHGPLGGGDTASAVAVQRVRPLSRREDRRADGSLSHGRSDWCAAHWPARLISKPPRTGDKGGTGGEGRGGEGEDKEEGGGRGKVREDGS